MIRSMLAVIPLPGAVSPAVGAASKSPPAKPESASKPLAAPVSARPPPKPAAKSPPNPAPSVEPKPLPKSMGCSSGPAAAKSAPKSASPSFLRTPRRSSIAWSSSASAANTAGSAMGAAFLGAMCRIFQLKLASGILPGEGGLTHDVAKDVLLGAVGILDPDRVSRSGTAELADIEVAPVGAHLHADILPVVERDDVPGLQAAERVERQAFQPDAGLERDGRSADLLLQLFRPFGLRIPASPAPFRETIRVLRSVLCGTMTEKVESTARGLWSCRSRLRRHLRAPDRALPVPRCCTGGRRRARTRRARSPRCAGPRRCREIPARRHRSRSRQRARRRLLYARGFGPEQSLDECDQNRAVAADLEVRAPVAQ